MRMNLQIRRATPDEAAVLTEIAHAAKRHWGYPENWIVHWKDDLTITPDFITTHEMYVAVAGEESGSLAEVEHMWIKPEHMGNGVGRALFNQVVARAKSLDARAVELSADPNAEGFYRRMGAKSIGEVRSEIEGQPRVLPRMSVDLEYPSPPARGARGEGA